MKWGSARRVAVVSNSSSSSSCITVCWMTPTVPMGGRMTGSKSSLFERIDWLANGWLVRDDLRLCWPPAHHDNIIASSRRNKTTDRDAEASTNGKWIPHEKCTASQLRVTEKERVFGTNENTGVANKHFTLTAKDSTVEKTCYHWAWKATELSCTRSN